MGKLIKNHWARLIVLTAGICKSTYSFHMLTHPKATIQNKTNQDKTRQDQQLT